MRLLCGSINVRERPWASKRQPIDYKRCCTDRLNAQAKSGLSGMRRTDQFHFVHCPSEYLILVPLFDLKFLAGLRQVVHELLIGRTEAARATSKGTLKR